MTTVIATLERPDGRSRWERRRRTIVRQLTGGLGRAVTASDRILIASIALATVQAEQLSQRLGQETDSEAIVRLGNIISRQLRQLGKPTPKALGPSLAEYLACGDKRTEPHPSGTP